MPVTRNTLIRLSVIDRCLRNRFRKWTIQDLIEACSDALYEYEGRDTDISLRTVRADLALMRSDKLGYRAPIIVVDKKYYTYEDPEYSITRFPLHQEDLRLLSEAMDILNQYKDFTQMQEAGDVISRLQDHMNVSARQKQRIIHLDTNPRLRGIDKIGSLYQFIEQQKVCSILYRSFRGKRAHRYKASGYLLKEYNNRWFFLCQIEGKKGLYTLALDRMEEITEAVGSVFQPNEQVDLAHYFDNIVGVTKNSGAQEETVLLEVNADQTPYILTKPLHPSQEIVEERENGCVISLKVIPNLELERLILGFGSHIRVLSPCNLQNRIKMQLQQALKKYKSIS